MKASWTNTLLLLVTGTLLISGWAIYNTTVPVHVSESRIWVEGTSNLHDWQCEAEQFSVSLAGDASIENLSGGSVVLLASQLDCDSNRMDRNTRDALKASDHQRITYQIQSAEVVTGNPGNLEITLNGQLSLAGVQRSVTVNAEASQMRDGRFRITGNTPLLMTDFGIDPPRAMMGALRTADEVTVGFELIAGNGS